MKLMDLPKHHAVLIERGEREAVGLVLWNELQALSPAHRFFNQTVLDIDTARSLITWAQTPYNDEKIAIVSFSTITLPAQNAMLKMLEEPRVGVRFILITSNKDNLIETVLSRICEFKTKNETRSTTSDDFANEFLRTPHALRMKLPFVVELLARLDEEGRKDREGVRAFVLSLSQTLSKKVSSSRYVLETVKVASYVSDPSASGKALVEYLSLLLPQVSA